MDGGGVQPPSAAGGMGGSGGSIGIGNYKGVMLCNRPFGGLAAAARVQESSGSTGGKGPFRCGCIPDEVGIQISKDPKAIRRPKKVTALTRHRRWLSELQRTKDMLETRYLEEVGVKEDRRKKFEAHEAKMRQQIRKVKVDSQAAAAKAAASEEASAESEEKETRGPETNEEQPPAATKPSSSSASSRRHHHHHRRPKWALTEGEAGVAEEMDQDEEAQELVDFARELNFEKYIGDMEVKTMMEQVVKRIHELEQAEARQEAREKDKAEFKRNLRITSTPMSNQTEDEEDDEMYSVGSGEEEEEEEDEVLALAKGVLRHRNVQRIHSARSAAAVVSKSLEKGGGGGLAAVAEAGEDKAGAEECQTGSQVAPPKIVRIDEDEGARIHGKKTPSQLPYLNRNPAV